MLRLCLILGALACPAKAEMLRTTVPVTVIASGGQCDTPPDATLTEPSAGGGTVYRNFGPTDYVVQGDRFPAQVGLGIGLRVRIEGYGPGSEVRVLIDPPVGKVGSWDMSVDPTGELDFGRWPAIGAALPEGRYLLSALDKGTYLFTYAITLDGSAEESLCVPVS